MIDAALAIGSQRIVAIMKLCLRDLEQSFWGVPDLLLWKTGTKEIFFVEVKSERDQLNNGQKSWLTLLEQIGCPSKVARIICAAPDTNLKKGQQTSTKRQKL